ncbi:hypothetical protein ACTMU2_26075 [Cupriavidus basilensis]
MTALAQAQSLVSTGQVKQDAAIGTGTIHIDFGATHRRWARSIPIPPAPPMGSTSGAGYTANTGSTGFTTSRSTAATIRFKRVRDAITKANAGVTASIINDEVPARPIAWS